MRVKYSIRALPEDTLVRGNAMASGDDAYDREVEDRILDEWVRGNIWAWCTVQVRARVGPFYGDAYLGCCSYDSAADFRRSSADYLEQMKEDARAELRQKIAEAKAIICP